MRNSFKFEWWPSMEKWSSTIAVPRASSAPAISGDSTAASRQDQVPHALRMLPTPFTCQEGPHVRFYPPTVVFEPPLVWVPKFRDALIALHWCVWPTRPSCLVIDLWPFPAEKEGRRMPGKREKGGRKMLWPCVRPWMPIKKSFQNCNLTP